MSITSDNPLRETLLSRQVAKPCSLVIFGATGDLTHRKLIPALYNLAADNDLPPGLKVTGFSRREKTDDSWRNELAESNRKNSRSGHAQEIWEDFASNLSYHRGDFNDTDAYHSLSRHLDMIDDGASTPHNRLFYLSTAPEFFPIVLENLKATGLNRSSNGGWSRVIIEKPMGSDLATAQELNRVLSNTFNEDDTYRIDHYLGKETAQNIMILRFANAIFEPLWRSRFIEQVQITCAEDLGMEGGRGGYYDTAGATRDMVQNHLLQLLCLIAMEPPTDLSADSVRDEKVKVLRSLRRMGPDEVKRNVVRARYTRGEVNGENVPGYLQEERIADDSNTESYVAMRVFIDNWRWEGTPFYIRMGKRLPKKATEISLHLKSPPNVLFQKLPSIDGSNVLTMRIQPDEGVSVRMLSKLPGNSLQIKPVKMDFHYLSSFGKGSPEAYERLLLDAMAGDATLFARRDEVENAWLFIDAIQAAWHDNETPPAMTEYQAGSWGPPEADQLLAERGHHWREI